MAGQPATVGLTLPAGVTYEPHSVTPSGVGEPSITAGGSRLTWNVTYASNGTTATFRFAVSVSGSAALGAHTVSGAMLAAALANEQTVATSFEVVDPSLAAVSPRAIGQAEHVTVAFSGALLAGTDTFELSNNTTTLKAESAQGPASTVNATFNTTSLPPGEYTGTVITASGQQLGFLQPVTVGGGNAPNLSVELNGPSHVHLNATGNFFATVTNTGNVDLYDVPVVFTAPTGVTATAVQPNAKTLLTEAVEAITSASPGPGELTPEQAKQVKSEIQAEEPTAVPDPDGEKQYLLAYIPEIPAGATATTEFQLHPTSYVTSDVSATVPVDSQIALRAARSSRRETPISRSRFPLFGESATGPARAAAVSCTRSTTSRRKPVSVTEQYVNSFQVDVGASPENLACMSFSDISGGLITDNCQFDPIGAIKGILLGKIPGFGPLNTAKSLFDLIKGLFDLGNQSD